MSDKNNPPSSSDNANLDNSRGSDNTTDYYLTSAEKQLIYIATREKPDSSYSSNRGSDYDLDDDDD